MIKQEEIQKILRSYNKFSLTVGVLGGHSALDVCRGAKKAGFKTVAVCQKGRDKVYSKYYRSRGDKGIIDHVILVDKFSDITKPAVQKKLRELNTIFIHNRYFWVYCDFKKIENNFKVPIFGTRNMVKLEERNIPKNQYYLLEKARIRLPKIYSDPKKIDRLCIVKASEAKRGYERAFFFVKSYSDYKKKSEELVKNGTVTAKNMKEAVIEEYILGAHVNFNFFYSPLTDELELMGTDSRRQTNLDGILRLPAPEQIEVLKHTTPKYIETGHFNVTTKESLIGKIYEIGEKFVKVTKKELPTEIIGPFALQGAVVADDGKEDLVIFDVSMRIPGSPGTRFTPHTGYLYLESISYGDRIAMELRKAVEMNALDKICT